MKTIKIFAKHMTTEKFAIICQDEQVRDIQKYLNETFGLNWLLVDNVKEIFEGIKFKDGLTYKGFHGREERYLNGIIKTSDDGVDLETCLGCDFEFERKIMVQDSSGNDFCPECWKALYPLIKKEYEDMKAKGEIEDDD